MQIKKVISIAKKYYKRGRAGDWNHAKRVAVWVKKLGDDREDIDILLTAAYLHDVGWSGIIKQGKINADEMLRLEKEANKNTTIFITDIMKKVQATRNQIDAVIRLAIAADQHLSFKEDEAIVVDADNLSKLCKEHVVEKYKPDSWEKMISLWEKEMPNRIKTDEGKRIYPTLLIKVRKDLDLY